MKKFNQVVTESAPVAYWSMDEAALSTQIVDSINSIAAVTNGTPTFQKPSLLVNEPTDYSIGFNGDNTSYFQSAYDANTDLTGSQWSIEAIFTHGAAQTAYAAVVANVLNPSVSIQATLHAYTTSNSLRISTYVNGTWYWGPEFTMTVGETYHAVGMWDGANLVLYINGRLIGKVAHTIAPVTNPNGWRIGSRWDTINTWNGDICEVAIYNRPLSPHEVLYHYIHTRQHIAYPYEVVSKGPLAYWRLGESTGTHAHNETGKHAGTYTGSPTLGVAGPLLTDPNTAITVNGAQGVTVLHHADFDVIEYNAPVSIGCWIDTSDVTAGVKKIINKELSSVGWNLAIDGTSGGVSFSMVNVLTTNHLQVTSTLDVRDGNWHYIVVTYNGVNAAGVKIYVDGVLTSTTTQYDTLTASILTSSNILIGMDTYIGSIDEVSIYSYEITPYEINTQYNVGITYKQPANYQELVKYSGPVSHWRLGESTGPTAVDAMGVNNGTYTGTPTFSVTGAIVNNTDTAISLSGDSIDGVTVPHSATLDFERTDKFSFEAWVSTSDITTGTKTIIVKSIGAPNYTGYGFAIDGDTGNPMLTLVNIWTSNTLRVRGVIDIRDGNWHHVVATYDGTSSASGVKIYVDGVPVALTTVYNSLTATISNTVDFNIGTQILIGSLDEVAVYNYVLSQYEVQRHYQKGAGTLADISTIDYLNNTKLYNPVAFYSMNETVNDGIIIDEMGLYNGTYVNTPTLNQSTEIQHIDPNWKSVFFNGASSEYATMDTLAPKLVTASTIETLFNTTNTVGFGNIIFSVHTSVGANVLLLAVYGNGNVYWNGALFGTGYNDGKWHHLVITSSATTVKCYIDGKLIGTSGAVVNYSTAARVSIGQEWDSGTPTDFYTGYISDVIYYAYELTPAEVSQRYYDSLLLNILGTWVISGTTQVQGTPTACIVRLYLRNDGILVTELTSDAIDGTYTFTNLEELGNYDVVCINNTVGICPQISGPLQPTFV